MIVGLVHVYSAMYIVHAPFNYVLALFLEPMTRVVHDRAVVKRVGLVVLISFKVSHYVINIFINL